MHAHIYKGHQKNITVHHGNIPRILAKASSLVSHHTILTKVIYLVKSAPNLKKRWITSSQSVRLVYLYT